VTRTVGLCFALAAITIEPVSAQVLQPPAGDAVVSRLFAATAAGPHVTYSWGEQWFQLRADTRGFHGALYAFACLGPSVFAGGTEGLYESEDYGESYRRIAGFDGVDVRVIVTARMFELEPTILVGTDSGLHRSVDRGLKWTRLGESLLSARVRDLKWPGPQLFAATDDGLYLSVDVGESWERLDGGLPTVPFLSLVASQFFLADPVLLVGTLGEGLYRSGDGGEHFERTGGREHEKATIHAMFWWGAVLIIGAEDGLYFSHDAGATLEPVDDLKGRRVLSISIPVPEGALRSDIIVGTDEGVYKSSDGGFRFFPVRNGLGRLAVTALSTFPVPVQNREQDRRR